MLRGLVCFLAWLTFFIAPSPIPGQAAKETARAKDAANNRSSNNQAVAPSPAVVNPSKAPIEQPSSRNVSRTNEPSSVRITELPHLPLGKDWMDRVAWVAGLILVAVGVGGVFLANRTLEAIRMQANHMREGLILTEQGLTLTRQSADAATASANAATRAADAANAQIELVRDQLRVMERQTDYMGDGLDLTRQATDVSKQSLQFTQRAFFTHVRYQVLTMFSKPNNEGDLLFFRFVIEYENVGNTPALNAEMILGFWKVNRDESENFSLPPWEEREGPRIASTVAPRIKVSGLLDLDIEEVHKMETGELSVFLYTQAQYRDVFPDTPIHTSGTCVKLIKIADLRSGNPFQFKLHSPKYNYGD